LDNARLIESDLNCRRISGDELPLPIVSRCEEQLARIRLIPIGRVKLRDSREEKFMLNFRASLVNVAANESEMLAGPIKKSLRIMKMRVRESNAVSFGYIKSLELLK
jgi:hypothetical protein